MNKNNFNHRSKFQLVKMRIEDKKPYYYDKESKRFYKDSFYIRITEEFDNSTMPVSDEEGNKPGKVDVVVLSMILVIITIFLVVVIGITRRLMKYFKTKRRIHEQRVILSEDSLTNRSIFDERLQEL